MRAHPRPWHRGSLFGAGPRRPLDRNQRARFRYLLDAHRRGGRLTPNAMLVGAALLRRLGEDGRCDPAHATLASDAGCGERTVRRALAVMRGLGLVFWQMRLVRAGWRAEQTSNAYGLLVDHQAAARDRQAALSIIREAQRCAGQRVRETESLCTIEARAALAAIAERRTRALRAAFHPLDLA